MYKDKKKHKVL